MATDKMSCHFEKSTQRIDINNPFKMVLCPFSISRAGNPDLTKWTISVEFQFIVFNEHQHNSAQSQNHRGRYHIRHWKNFLSFMKGRIISIAWALWCHVHVSVINILVNSELISKQGLHITFILLIQVYSYATSHVILSDNASNNHTKSTSRQKYWLVTFKKRQ